jgi:anti-sigma regulatory factor (Ser/Thr protein kinase)
VVAVREEQEAERNGAQGGLAVRKAARTLCAHAELSAVPRAAAHARRTVRQALQRWRVRPSVVEDVQLIASELVSNAQRYGGRHVGLELSLTGDELTVAVADSSSDRPAFRRSTSALEDRGRGLPIVTVLADAWGVREFAGGKRVWARLSIA